MRTFLLRHGESASNAAQGIIALPEEEGDRLTELGREQARSVAEEIAAIGIARLVCSPMGRARETAEPIAASTGLEPETWDWIHELREPDGYAGWPLEEQARNRWSNRMSRNPDDPEHSLPGGESFADMTARVDRMREKLAADAIDRTLVVGHGIFCRFMFAMTVLGEGFEPSHADRLWRIGSLNCGLSSFDYVREQPSENPSEISGWRCVTWMAPPTGVRVTGTGGAGPGG